MPVVLLQIIRCLPLWAINWSIGDAFICGGGAIMGGGGGGAAGADDMVIEGGEDPRVILGGDFGRLSILSFGAYSLEYCFWNAGGWSPPLRVDDESVLELPEKTKVLMYIDRVFIYYKLYHIIKCLSFIKAVFTSSPLSSILLTIFLISWISVIILSHAVVSRTIRNMVQVLSIHISILPWLLWMSVHWRWSLKI